MDLERLLALTYKQMNLFSQQYHACQDLEQEYEKLSEKYKSFNLKQIQQQFYKMAQQIKELDDQNFDIITDLKEIYDTEIQHQRKDISDNNQLQSETQMNGNLNGEHQIKQPDAPLQLNTEKLKDAQKKLIQAQKELDKLQKQSSKQQKIQKQAQQNNNNINNSTNNNVVNNSHGSNTPHIYQSYNAEMKITAMKMIEEGAKLQQISKQFNIPPATIYYWQSQGKNKFLHKSDSKQNGQSHSNSNKQSPQSKQPELDLQHFNNSNITTDQVLEQGQVKIEEQKANSLDEEEQQVQQLLNIETISNDNKNNGNQSKSKQNGQQQADKQKPKKTTTKISKSTKKLTKKQLQEELQRLQNMQKKKKTKKSSTKQQNEFVQPVSKYDKYYQKTVRSNKKSKQKNNDQETLSESNNNINEEIKNGKREIPSQEEILDIEPSLQKKIKKNSEDDGQIEQEQQQQVQVKQQDLLQQEQKQTEQQQE